MKSAIQSYCLRVLQINIKNTRTEGSGHLYVIPFVSPQQSHE